MLRSVEINLGGQLSRLLLNSFGVRFHAANTRPAHINPDFLRVNEIVPSEWVVERPVVLETGHSRVEYSNGFTVTAGDRFVYFYQQGLVDPAVELAAIDVASRYFECSPRYLSVDTLVITPACLLVDADDFNTTIASPISGLAIPFGDITPRLFVRVSYRLEDKDIDVTLSDGLSFADNPNLRFRVGGIVNFSLTTSNRSGIVASVQDALAESTTAVDHFYEIARHLCTRYLDLEVG